MKLLRTFFLVSLLITPGPGWAQDNSAVISQFRKTVFTLQQEMLELKNQIDRQGRDLLSQKEELGLQVERLNDENKKMRKHLLEMDSLIFQMEDRLETSSLIKLSKELQTLRSFNQAVILDNINQIDQSEKLLLEILNQPDASLPKDLLILLLAQQKKRQQLYNESISYYSTLLAEFSGSTYFSQAIYEMSEILGESGKAEQQITLLAQLSSLSETDPYSIKAQEKLKELGAETLFEEEAIKPDATPDVEEENLVKLTPVATQDATADNKTITVSENTVPGIKPDHIDSSSDASADAEKQPATKEGTAILSSSEINESEKQKKDKESAPAENKSGLESQEIKPEPDTTPDISPDNQSG